MEENTINKENVINHWISTSEEDYETMMQLFKNNNYSWALFLGHISTEKILKAYYVKEHSKHAPFTHNLYRIAELSNLSISEVQADWLDKITTFNINADTMITKVNSIRYVQNNLQKNGSIKSKKYRNG